MKGQENSQWPEMEHPCTFCPIPITPGTAATTGRDDQQWNTGTGDLWGAWGHSCVKIPCPSVGVSGSKSGDLQYYGREPNAHGLDIRSVAGASANNSVQTVQVGKGQDWRSSQLCRDPTSCVWGRVITSNYNMEVKYGSADREEKVQNDEGKKWEPTAR